MPVAVTHQRTMTAEEFFTLDVSPSRAELIDGELVVMSPASWEHNDVATRLLVIFQLYARTRKGLRAGNDNDGFVVRRNPDLILSPDVSLTAGTPKRGVPWIPFAPGIAVEVLSPSNTESEQTMRRHTFFEAGTEQFWLIDMDDKTLSIYFRDGRRITYSGPETVCCEGVAEGLEFGLRELWGD